MAKKKVVKKSTTKKVVDKYNGKSVSPMRATQYIPCKPKFTDLYLPREKK
jgi:hypothetical protein